MGYSLGIDVGTTFTAAAIWRDGQVEVVALESHRVAIPSVVFASGGDVVFGTAAVGRAMTEPAGAAREFKRRLGDPVPVMLSGAPYSADRLVALFAQWVRSSVTEQFGESPERVVVTHPANWTEFQLHLLATALQQAEVGETGLLSEPQAAAVDFGAAAHLEPGELVVVYDLGGGTFDVVLLRREADGFAHVGEPAGVERLGGIDFDEAVFQHVISHVPDEAVTQARSDQPGRMALSQLRRACVEAKERLSNEVAVEVPVVLPAHTSAVRLTRSEFESMIRPMLQQTVALVRQVIDRAGLRPDQLSAILLVGGSSRIPLVSELVGQAIGAPVRVDAHPKLVVARGAARWAGSGLEPPAPHAEARSRRKWWLAAAGVGALVAVGAGAMALTGGDGERTSDDTEPTSATVAGRLNGGTATDPAVTQLRLPTSVANTVAPGASITNTASTVALTTIATSTTVPTAVPDGFKRAEFDDRGVQFVVPETWRLIDPGLLDLSDPGWAAELAASTGMEEDFLRETVGRGVPYVFSDDRNDVFVPNILVESLPQFPSVDDLVTTLLHPDENEPVPDVTDAGRLSDNLDVVYATYVFDRGQARPVVGNALVVGLSDKIVLIHVRTFDPEETTSISEKIISTIGALD